MTDYNKIIKFWFSDKTRKLWLYNHTTIYNHINDSDIFYIIKHLNIYFNQVETNLDNWLKHPKGALALLILTTEYPYYALIKNPHVYGSITNSNLSNKIIKHIIKHKLYKSYNKF